MKGKSLSRVQLFATRWTGPSPGVPSASALPWKAGDPTASAAPRPLDATLRSWIRQLSCRNTGLVYKPRFTRNAPNPPGLFQSHSPLCVRVCSLPPEPPKKPTAAFTQTRRQLKEPIGLGRGLHHFIGEHKKKQPAFPEFILWGKGFLRTQFPSTTDTGLFPGLPWEGNSIIEH